MSSPRILASTRLLTVRQKGILCRVDVPSGNAFAESHTCSDVAAILHDASRGRFPGWRLVLAMAMVIVLAIFTQPVVDAQLIGMGPQNLPQQMPSAIRSPANSPPSVSRPLAEHDDRERIGQTELPPYLAALNPSSDASLRAVDAKDPEHVVAVGDHGLILLSEDGGEVWREPRSPAACRLDDVVWVNQTTIVAAGGYYDLVSRMSRGVVLVSRDGGRNWRANATVDLPRVRRLTVHQGRLYAETDWSCASRGRFFESRDNGNNWQAINNSQVAQLFPSASAATGSDLQRWCEAVGSPLAIRDRCMIESSTIFAVGDHGVIVSSRDSGVSWQTLRGAGRRPAILIVTGALTNIPWSVLGRESIEHGNRVAVLVLQQTPSGSLPRRSESSPNGDLLDWTRQGVMGLAGSGVDVIQVPNLLESTGQPEHARDVLANIMAWLNICRPATLLMDGQLTETYQNTLLSSAVATGTRRIALFHPDHRGRKFLLSTSLMPQAGVLAGDFAADALLVQAPCVAAASSVGLDLRYDVAGQAARLANLTEGIRLQDGQRFSTRRRRESRRRLQVLQARLQQDTRIEEMLSRQVTPKDLEQAFQLSTDHMAPEDRFRFAWSLVRRVARAQDSHRLLPLAMGHFCEAFPDRSASRLLKLHLTAWENSLERKRLPLTIQPESEPIRLQSIHVEAGSEIESNARSISKQDSLEAFSSEALPASPGIDVAAVSPFQDNSQVIQAGAFQSIRVPQLNAPKYRSEQQIRRATEIDLQSDMHPLAMLIKRAGKVAEDTRTQSHVADLKRIAAAESNWSPLFRSFGHATVQARKIESPPRLDGVFDEPFWSEKTPWASGARGGATVACCYDDRFVYFAIRCPSDWLASQNVKSGPPFRDCDLGSSDRLQISLDCDQDLLTAMHLECTANGKTRDGIDGDLQLATDLVSLAQTR